MEYRDLREWIEKIEKIGELRRLNGADWNLEIGTVTELVNRSTGPAVLFDEIKGYPRGHRVLTNSLGSLKRLSLTMGLPLDLDTMGFVKAWRDRAKELKPIAPHVVKNGPVLENVQQGKDVDLLKFPTPFWHHLDGGRYIGTGCLDITRDPDEGWVNLGTYRIMLHDKNTVGFYISPGKHGRIMREKYFSRKEPFKIAISVGQDPLLFVASSLEIPWAYSEYEWVGAVRGEPVEVIEGPWSGLPIPAHAEIVLEGEVSGTDLRDEGPFGEWTGYYGSDMRAEPTIKIHSVLHRNDPRPPSDATFFRCFIRSAMLWDQVEKAGVPDVKGVWQHQAGGSRLFTVIAIKQRYPGHARQAAVCAAQCHAGAYLGRFTVVVDDDIDISNTDDVLWAI
ncbi:MAG: UbiD family decarboxylase [Deltaproteobacteria bacterium]|nr:UbiD family decarboxylase [Deltaproteobacteria bacterium]